MADLSSRAAAWNRHEAEAAMYWSRDGPGPLG